MEMEKKLSAAQAGIMQLQKKTTSLDATEQSIARLASYAMETPESRKEITTVLKGYMAKRRGTQGATAASRAVETILAVSMLEALQD